MKIVLIFSAILVCSSAQKISPGHCKDEKVVQNFNVEKYTGLWYEVYRYPQIHEAGANCVTAQYSRKDDAIEIHNKMVLNGTSYSIIGNAMPDPEAKGAGKLLIDFPTTQKKLGNYLVLSTDYDNYSLVYSCSNFDNNTKRVSSWILSRNKTLSPEAVSAITPALEAAEGLEWKLYKKVYHTDAACKSSN